MNQRLGFKPSWSFANSRLSDDQVHELMAVARQARGDILTMTTVAASGHPGGSMSSIDFLLLIYALANIDPEDPWRSGGDRVVVSHGHVSPAAYSALAATGFVDREQLLSSFRLLGSSFEGHVEQNVPGVFWSTGNLGQGLSAGCGFALAAQMGKRDSHVFVAMSDGEQTKGQVAEARRFAAKYGLSNLTAIIDKNLVQMSGPISEIMPTDITAEYRADGWIVYDADGHDFNDLFKVIKQALADGQPSVIIAKTHMGQGVSFMIDDHNYHGQSLKPDQYRAAMIELGLPDELETYLNRRKQYRAKPVAYKHRLPLDIPAGMPHDYLAGEETDNRSAFGRALVGIAKARQDESTLPVLVFDCDVKGSTKTDGFEAAATDNFYQGGIQEHNTATVAGAVSKEGYCVFFADFGVFGLIEAMNQHRLNDINGTNLKLVLTHCGIDVGEDGKTHHCIDYVSKAKDLFGFKMVVPADPNQTDRATRFIAGSPGNWIMAMGRSKAEVIIDECGRPLFGHDYRFEYGAVDVIRRGSDGAIFAMGTIVVQALEALGLLADAGLRYALYHVSSPKIIPAQIVLDACARGPVVSVEDHCIHTGLGSSLDEIIVTGGAQVQRLRLGVTGYSSSGSASDLRRAQHLDAAGIYNAIMEFVR